MQLFSYRLFSSASCFASCLFLLLTSPVHATEQKPNSIEQGAPKTELQDHSLLLLQEIDKISKQLEQAHTYAEMEQLSVQRSQLQEQLKQEELQMHRLKMLSYFSTETQTALLHAEKSYLAVMNRLNLMAIIEEAVDVIQDQLDTLQNFPEQEELSKLVASLRHSLATGTFMKIIMGQEGSLKKQQISEESIKQMEEDFKQLYGALYSPSIITAFRDTILALSSAFTAEDLARLGVLLEQAQALLIEQDQLTLEQAEAWNKVLTIFNRVLQHDIDKISLDALAQLTPAFVAARQAVKAALQALDQEEQAVIQKLIEERKKDADQEGSSLPDDPVYFWRQQLHDYKKQLTTLAWFTTGTLTTSHELSATFFKQVSYGYSFLQGLFTLYKIDEKTSYQRGVISRRVGALYHLPAWPHNVNNLMWVILKLWDVCNVRSLLVGKASTMLLSGKVPTEFLDPQALLIMNALSALICIDQLPMVSMARNQLGHHEPQEKKSDALVKKFYDLPFFAKEMLVRIPTVWIYYHAIHCYSLEADSSSLFHQDNHAVWWPNHYRHMISAVSTAIKGGEEYLAALACGKLYQNATTETLDALENYSLGLIKPELITFVGRVLLPSVICDIIPEYTGYSLDPIAQVRPNDLRSWMAWASVPLSWHRWIGQLPDPAVVRPQAPSFWSRYIPRFSGILPQFFGITAAQARSIAQGNSDTAFYLETQIYYYLLSTIGGHLGGKFAMRHKEAVINAGISTMNGAASLAGTIGIFSDDEVAEFQASWSTQFDFFKIQLMLALQEVHSAESQLHKQARLFFLQTKKITAEAPAKEVNLVIISEGLQMLARGNILGYKDARSLMITYYQDPENLEQFSELLLTTIVNCLVKKAGEYAGSGTALVMGSLAMHHYGPFYPRIREALR